MSVGHRGLTVVVMHSFLITLYFQWLPIDRLISNLWEFPSCRLPTQSVNVYIIDNISVSFFLSRRRSLLVHIWDFEKDSTWLHCVVMTWLSALVDHWVIAHHIAFRETSFSPLFQFQHWYNIILWFHSIIIFIEVSHHHCFSFVTTHFFLLILISLRHFVAGQDFYFCCRSRCLLRKG